MNAHVILLVFLLIFALALVCALCWPQPGLVQSRAEASVRTTLPHLRHRHAPQTIVLSVVSPPLPPWVEGLLLVLYTPGARGKVGGEPPNV
jgi:hypothetical protein